MSKIATPIQELGEYAGNKLLVKREDLIPYSFGGNKARKGFYFFEEIKKQDYDCVVTYGSSHSNHCRIVSNLAAFYNIPCYIVGPEEVSDKTFNSCLMDLFGAKVMCVPVNMVHDAIEMKLSELRKKGKKPYFIPGGGHGNLGTQAYVECYKEIMLYEKNNNTHFDYIFFASGTGTTQAGLVVGQLLYKQDRNIIGISIARKKPYGREVILESIREYCREQKIDFDEKNIDQKTIFIDKYIANGYGEESDEIQNVIKEAMIQYGIPLDGTYTAKAFWGMKNYLKENDITGKRILFIHTGGTPLFFDDLRRFNQENEYFDIECRNAQ